MEILRTIMEWLKRPITDVSSPVYWVNGLAGIGKSTIAQMVGEQAKDSALPIATFFFTCNNAALRWKIICHIHCIQAGRDIS